MKVDKIVNLINTNFKKDDLLVSLTYKSKCKPTLEEAKIDIQEYIKRIKRYRHENGLEDLKYLFVIRPKDKRRGISHKILINSIDEKVAEDLWNKGYANAGRLKEDDSIEMIGRYITKDLKDSRYYGKSKFEEKQKYQDKKETAHEVQVQEQPLININQLRVENGLGPIKGGDNDFISIIDKNKKTAGIENQVQLEKLYENELENGVKLNVSISAKIENLDQEIFVNNIEKNIHEILQSISISTRNFYLLFGNEINNKLL